MTWVGLDVHARSTHGAAIHSLTGELERVRFGGGAEPVVAWLRGLRGPVRAAYEAGPTGFGLARAAEAAGIAMQVVAPGRTPRAATDRVKTDRKDAELLARLLLAGQLTAAFVPPDWVEAMRHLTRRREQVRGDVMQARHRISKLLLIHGRVWDEPKTWTQRHRQCLAAQVFDHEATELVFVDALAALDGLLARREVLDERLGRLALDDRVWPTVSRLRCFRGIDTLTALTVHLELGGDWRRFGSARQVGAWLGLTPSLTQSGESSTQGSITKTGSSLARRLLVESAWQYMRPPRIGVTLRNRQQGQPDHVLQTAWRAQQRLFKVHQKMHDRGKPHNVITVAVARELAGFLWAAATAP